MITTHRLLSKLVKSRFVIKKAKNIVPWSYIIEDLNGEEIVGIVGTNQKDFRIEKVIKKKGEKLYVKWKDYGNLYDSWINRKRLIQLV